MIYESWFLEFFITNIFHISCKMSTNLKFNLHQFYNQQTYFSSRSHICMFTNYLWMKQNWCRIHQFKTTSHAHKNCHIWSKSFAIPSPYVLFTWIDTFTLKTWIHESIHFSVTCNHHHHHHHHPVSNQKHHETFVGSMSCWLLSRAGEEHRLLNQKKRKKRRKQTPMLSLLTKYGLWAPLHAIELQPPFQRWLLSNGNRRAPNKLGPQYIHHMGFQ